MPKPTKSTSGSQSRRKKVPNRDAGAGGVLEEIYGNEAEQASKPSLKQIEQKSERRLAKVLVWSLVGLGLIVAAAAAGFYVFNRDQKFNDQGVELSIDTPVDAPSGGETTLTFVIKNNERVGIKNIELSVSPPDGWTFVRSETDPDSDNRNLWKLGSLGAGRQLALPVTGILVGEVGSVKSFSATVTYRPTNFNYDFSDETSGSVTIATSILDVQLEGPTQVNPGAAATYVLTYTNTSDAALKDIRFTALYPEGFSSNEQKPKPQNGNNVWMVGELASGASGKLEVTGTFAGDAGASVQFTFTGDLRQDAIYEKQVETSLVVLLSNASLTLELSANKKKASIVAKPEDVVSYTLVFQNKSDAELANVTVRVAFTGGGLDAASFADDDGAKLKDNAATWDSKLIPQLASVKPNGSGTIRFSLKVPASPSVTKNAGGPTLSAQASASVDGKESTKLDPLVAKITTVATLVVDPRYYKDDGTQLGAGPLPPHVGDTTTYRVFWRLTNTANELTDLTVSAKLPLSVFWTGKNTSTTAGTITFDAATRTVTWKLNKLPAGVGIGSTPVSAGFDVSITPEADAAGTLPTLVERAALTATDSFTVTKVEVAHDAVATDLPKDTKAAGKGVVVSS